MRLWDVDKNINRHKRKLRKGECCKKKKKKTNNGVENWRSRSEQEVEAKDKLKEFKKVLRCVREREREWVGIRMGKEQETKSERK